MGKGIRKKYPETISFRLSWNERHEFDLLMNNLQTNKSEFIRKKIRRILKSITR
jgi:hypothetical protein